MVKCVLKTIFLITTLNFATISISGQQNDLENVSPVDNIENKKTNESQGTKDKIQEVYNEKQMHQIHLDIINPIFKELKLTITNNNDTPNNISCDKCEIHTIGRSENDDSKNIPVVERNIPNETHKEKIDVVTNLSAGRNELESRQREMLKLYADTASDLRCIGEECTSDKDKINKYYYENNNNILSNITKYDDKHYDVIEYEREAINDWATFSKDTKQCKKKKCDPRLYVKKTIRNEDLRSYSKHGKLREKSKGRGKTKTKIDSYESDNVARSLKAYDLIEMFDRNREMYEDLILRYIQEPGFKTYKRVTQETKDNLRKIRTLYRLKNGRIREDFLRESIKNELKRFETNPLLSHDENVISIPRNLYNQITKHLQKSEKNHETIETPWSLRNIISEDETSKDDKSSTDKLKKFSHVLRKY